MVGLPYGVAFVLPPLAQGLASVTNGRMKVIDNFNFGYATNKRKDFLLFNWSFVDKYISGFSQAMDKYFSKVE
jgi:hypothetical protein